MVGKNVIRAERCAVDIPDHLIDGIGHIIALCDKDHLMNRAGDDVIVASYRLSELFELIFQRKDGGTVRHLPVCSNVHGKIVYRVV